MPITLNYTFTAATTIQSSQVNDNFTQITTSAPSISAAETISGVWTFSGANVHSGNSTVTGTMTFDADGVHIFDTNASHDLILTPGSDLTADRVLTLTTGDAARTITISGDTTISQDYSTTGSPQFTSPSFTTSVTTGSTTLGVFDATATTVNAFGASTATTLGAATGYTNLRHNLFVNDTSNANMTLGVTINQGVNDNEILALKSSDVAHGVTDLAETDTFAHIQKRDALEGGAHIRGFSTATIALLFTGVETNDSTSKTTASIGPLRFIAQKRSGTGVADLGADANIAAFANNATTRFILDGDGDSHQDVGTAWTNYDDADDIVRLDAVAVTLARDGDPLREQFTRHMEQHRAVIEAMPGKRLVTFNDDGHHFVNMSRLTMLHTGAIRQLARQCGHIASRIVQLERTLPPGGTHA